MTRLIHPYRYVKGGGGGGAPVIENYTTANSGNSQTFSISVATPAGTQDGDLLIGMGLHRTDVDIGDTPNGTWLSMAGYTFIISGMDPTPSDDATIDSAIFYRIASSEPANRTIVNADDRGRMLATILRITGAGDPSQIQAGVHGVHSDGESREVIGPSLNATKPSLLLSIFTRRGNEHFENLPPTATTLFNIWTSGSGGDPCEILLMWEHVDAGPTGTRSARQVGFNGHAAAHTVLIPGA